MIALCARSVVLAAVVTSNQASQTSRVAASTESGGPHGCRFQVASPAAARAMARPRSKPTHVVFQFAAT